MKPVALLFIVASSAYGATWIPLLPTNSGTFFNADIVYENDGSPTAGATIGSRYLFENGLNGSSPGLVVGGAYTYASTGAQFQLQPYDGNNVSRTTSNGASVTANFASGYYDTIAVAAAVGNQNAGATMTWTITYSDLTTSAGSFIVEDWGSTSQTNELFNVSRALSGGAADGTSTYWSAYVYEIDADPTRLIQSITLVATPTGRPVAIAVGQPGYPGTTPSTNTGDVHIFGFSGQVIPEPSTALLLGTALSFSFLRRRK